MYFIKNKGYKMIIAIDLGSNTFRLNLMQNLNGKYEIIDTFERIVGSARGLKRSGKISNEAKEDIFKAIAQAKEKFDFDKINHIAVATQAFRVASNADEIFKEIEQKFNVKFKIISGEAEAKLTFLGVKEALNGLGMDTKNSVFIDLGGGSSEISNGDNFKSFEFGIITFCDQFDNDISLMRKNVATTTKEAKEFLAKFDKKHIILTSGVPTTMAALKLGMGYDDYDKSRVNGYRLFKDDFDGLMCEILKFDNEKADKLLGKNRKMPMLGGMLLLKELLCNEKAELVVIDDGLREGVGVAYFNKSLDEILKF